MNNLGFRVAVTLFTLFILPIAEAAGDKAARAIIVKGKVVYELNGESKKVTRNLWLPEGAQVHTEKGSFTKLMFIDRSSINVGPDSTMKIESFPKDKAGIISLVKGKIRSKVTKNYMDNKETDKSKLFIKTKTAAMGVRGTDFQVSFNEVNEATSLVTFEGAVAMGQINGELSQFDQNKLESIVSNDQAVIVRRGQFSGASPRGERVTEPTKISPVQLETLEKNEVPGISSAGTNQANPSSEVSQVTAAPAKKYRSIVPPGMDAKEVANTSQSLDSAISQVAGPSASVTIVADTPQIESISDNQAPKAGGFIDIETAQYIPPPANSTFDPNTGVYIPPADTGRVDPATGNYTNDHYNLNPDGTFTAKVDSPQRGSDSPTRGIASTTSVAPEAPKVMDASQPNSEISENPDFSSDVDPSLVNNITEENRDTIEDFQNSDNNQVYGSGNRTNVTVRPVVK